MLTWLPFRPVCVWRDDNPFSGGVFLGGRALSLDHQSAKFNEYNGIAPGLFGGGNCELRHTDKYHFDVDGAYLGEDDMHLKMNGGKWGSFKFSLFYTEFPHNLLLRGPDHLHRPRVSQNLTLPGRASATPKTPPCGRAPLSITRSRGRTWAAPSM